MEEKNEQNWTLEVKSNTGWFDLNLKEVWAYKDLIYMFVKRDFVAQYVQTVLGPLWYILQPLFTTVIYSLVFGNIANIPTDGQPTVLFYMSGLLFWNFFSTNFLKNSETLTSNAGMFGKVYFPRLTVPIATSISGLFTLAIQLILLLGFYIYFKSESLNIHTNRYVLLFPIYLILVMVLSMSLGIIASSLTTKYRDLKFLLGFGIQLAMWATPIVYPMSLIQNEQLKAVIQFNPMAPIVEGFRYGLLGTGTFSWTSLSYTVVFTIVSALIGLMLFNKVEKDFMDSV